MSTPNIEQFIDHEVRLRMNESKYDELKEKMNEGIRLLRWILVTAIGAVLIPIVLHHYNLA